MLTASPRGDYRCVINLQGMTDAIQAVLAHKTLEKDDNNSVSASPFVWMLYNTALPSPPTEAATMRVNLLPAVRNALRLRSAKA
jgi:hypothetical protein